MSETIIDLVRKDDEKKAVIRIVNQDGTDPALLSVSVGENGINIILLDDSPRSARFYCRSVEVKSHGEHK